MNYLNIEKKEDSPEKLAAVAGIPSRYFLASEEVNEIVEGVNQLSKNVDLAVVGSNLGLLKVTDTPPLTGKHKGDVEAPGTYTNFGAIVFTQPELNSNYGYIYVDEGVSSKILSPKKDSTIGDGSVTTTKTDFAVTEYIYSKNRFKKETITVGKYVDSTTGNIFNNASYDASDYIYVKGLSNIVMTQLIHIAFYDKDKVYISGRNFGGDTIAVPINAVYCRISLGVGGNLNVFQLEEGTVKTAYESYVVPVEKIVIPKLKYDAEIAENSITPIKTTFAQIIEIHAKNRFNKATTITSKYVKAFNGALADNISYSASDYMYVRELTDIILTKLTHIAFYDANKVYISGRENGADTIAVPLNAVYCRISLPVGTNLNTFQVESGTVKTTYEAYVVPVEKVIIPNLKYDAEIAENSITPIKTNFIKDIEVYSKNRFNKATAITVGKYVNSTNGILQSNPTYNASDFIYVKGLSNIVMTQLIHIAFYDKDKIYISGRDFGGNTIAVPMTAVYCRISLGAGANLNTFQVESGTIKTISEPYSSPYSAVQIDDLYIDPIKSLNIDIIAQSKIWWLQGKQLNIYFDNVIMSAIGKKSSDSYNLAFSDKGQLLEKKYRFLADATTSVTLKSEILEASIEKKITIEVAPTSSGNGVTRKVLVIGDSTVNAGITLKEMYDFFNLDLMKVNFLGTRNSLGVNHEGRSGWTFANYTSNFTDGLGNTNPFWNSGTSSFDFSAYLTNTSQSMSDNDWVFIQLGINDFFSMSRIDGAVSVSTILTSVQNSLSAMISSIHSYNPNIRIGIAMTIPPAISQDSTGNLLNSSLYSLEYYIKKGLMVWWKYLLSTYDNDTTRTNKIYLNPMNLCIDRVNNFPTASQPLDSVNNTSVIVQNNDVHPNTDGYKQVALPYISIIKFFG